MPKIAIVTDSSANLPSHLIKAHNIHVVPVYLQWNGQIYRDGVDLSPNDLYRRLRTSETLPTTAAPSVGDFLEVYQRLSKSAEAIVSLHMPPVLSSIFDAAHLAAQMVKEVVTVRVVNCKTAAMGQGFVVLAAARAAQAGADLDEVVARAEEVSARVRVYATLEHYEYLQRSGRVPILKALAGSLLHINPIFSLSDGRADVVEMPRSRQRAVTRLIELMREQVGNRPVHVAVFHADVPAEAKALRTRIAAQFRCVELYITEFTPVMGAHTGPGVLGIAFYAE